MFYYNCSLAPDEARILCRKNKEVFVDASIKESVIASDKEAQYDEKAKKLLGHKIILAYILVNIVEEFQEMNPKDVVKYIEGEPYISTVPIDPGMTNTKEKKNL